MMFNCVKALAATDSTHLRQKYIIIKLLANYFFSADPGHVRFFRLTHKPLNSATPNFEVVCEDETTHIPELINKIALGKTSKPPRAASTALSTFKLDTGALYLETMQSGGDQQNTYSRLSRLVEFYYFETTTTSGRASTWPAQAP